MPVRVVERAPGAAETLASILGPAVQVLVAAAIVVLLTAFLLAYRVDLRDRLIRLVSRGHIGLTTQAFDEANRRVSRYLLANLMVNVLYGAAVGLSLWAVGLSNAPLWGCLAGLLRFVPYIGVWIGALLPAAAAFATSDGWGATAAAAGVVLGIDALVGNLLEPLFYGRRTGLSPLAVIGTTVFWTWLWGVPGLLLAVPMTLCLAVAGRYVPGLEFLDVLLGSAPALGPAERVYQRLVALDPAGAAQVASARLAEASLEETYDDLLLAAVRRASVERHLEAIDDARMRDVGAGVLEAADSLVRPDRDSGGEASAAPAARVLCLPAGDEPDRVACELLARLLAERGIAAGVGSVTALSGEVAERVEQDGPDVACVASVPPFAGPRVRYLVKRIRARTPGCKLVAAVWNPAGDRTADGAALAAAGADRAAFTLAEAVEGVLGCAAEARVAVEGGRR